jgi:murein L,D-transpeptidase YafK
LRVSKSRHELSVYYKQRPFKNYQAVFGRSRWAGAKQWEGDLRTPEGNYLIVERHPSRRFRWFLTLNYPNAIDLARFQELRSAHEIAADTRAGGRVGIHGTDQPMLNLGGVNWTTGCISVNNADISELAELLPIGTLVVINP